MVAYHTHTVKGAAAMRHAAMPTRQTSALRYLHVHPQIEPLPDTIPEELYAGHAGEGSGFTERGTASPVLPQQPNAATGEQSERGPQAAVTA